MFSESLVESSGIHHRGNRAWTTAASLAAQLMLLSALAMVPVLYPEALSLVHRTPDIPLFVSTPQPLPPAHATPRPASASPVTLIPVRNSGIHYGHAQPISDAHDMGAPTSSLFPQGTGSNLQIVSSYQPPRLDTQRTVPLRLSHMDPGSLIHYVKPQYPQLAVLSRTQGAVELHAVISKEGAIESLQLVSGNPLLSRAAIEAVREWRYRPYMLNGQPVVVETQITVNFTLDRQ